jgi:hypothetical protein
MGGGGVHLKKRGDIKWFIFGQGYIQTPTNYILVERIEPGNSEKKFQSVKSCIKVALHRSSKFRFSFIQEKIALAVYYEIWLFIHF